MPPPPSPGGSSPGSSEGPDLRELRGLTLSEADDLLRSIAEHLRRFEADPSDEEALEEVATCGHTLKGSAAMVELGALSEAGAMLQVVAERAAELAADQVERARDLAAAARSALQPARLLLEAADDPQHSAELLARMRSSLGGEEALGPDATGEIAAEREADPWPAPGLDEARDGGSPQPHGGPETGEFASALLAVFRGELEELLADVPDLLAGLVDPAEQPNLCADLARILHTVAGSAGTAGAEDVQTQARTLEQAFEEAAERTAEAPLEPAFLERIRAPIAALFLAAGLEPPGDALAAVEETTSASLVDADEAAVRPKAPDPAEPPVDPEMMEAFTLDAESALEACEAALLELERQPGEAGPLRTLFRQFHTLKGAAAAVGLGRMAEQLHAGESLLEELLEGEASLAGETLVDLLLELVDSVAGLLAECRGRSHGHRILDDVAAHVAAARCRAADAPPAIAPPSLPPPPTAAVPAPAEPGQAPSEGAIVRVHAHRLDLLMSRVGELVVSRTRIEDAIGALQELRDKLSVGKLRMNESIEGLRGFEFHAPDASPERTGRDTTGADDFTDLEFDKYDDFHVLTRTLVELSADTVEIVEQVAAIVDVLAEESRQVSKVTSSLQRTITGMRLLSLDGLFRRLARPVRDAARQTGKQAELRTSGGDVQLDRGVIEALYGPLLHLVRNAVSHGIEPSAEREALGKPRCGSVEIAAAQGHGHVQLWVRDDGRGLDYAAIHAKAERLGWLPSDAAPTREQLAEFIFRPGFSTQAEVTDLAGRGVGMDVVAREIEKMRGTLSVASEDGAGAIFRIDLPLATVIDQVLLLRTREQTYALSQGPIETILQIEPDRLRPHAGGLELQLGGELLPALPLERLVGLGAGRPGSTAVVLRAGSERLALIVDRVEAQREAVIRPLGPLFAGHPFVTSATFAGDGQVIFVLDAGRLAQAREAIVRSPLLAPPSLEPEPGPAAAGGTPAVLWADDSISVRKLAEHFLAAAGWRAETAVDGRDALDRLRRGRFSLLVTDLEMPRMHGYELLHEIRHDPDLRHLPVVVCSSRSSEKHRRRAREAGADGYLTKPFTQEALDRVLRECAPGSGGARSSP